MINISECKIRFANYDDIPAIMQYIDKYWKKNHILARDKELFEWQYINYGQVNFVIATDINDKIQGILGYIPYSQSSDKDIALALWKANHSESFLGIRMLLFLKKELEYNNIVCTGINMKTTSKIYTQCGFMVGKMSQWYRLSNTRNYIIGKIKDYNIPCCSDLGYSLSLLDNIGEIQSWIKSKKENDVPYKSLEYLKKRYFGHPYYQYMVYKVIDLKDNICGILVLRIQTYNQSRVFRFVDFIGNTEILKGITSELDKLMEQYEVEYIDMYEAGLDEEMLEQAGWIKVEDTCNIIPNYFAPFEQSNVDIYYSSTNEHAVLFRGDGDQDRPN